MSFTPDQIYQLLPAIYRIRDVDNGQPLQALLAAIAAQAGIVSENIQQLYDDEFIETCANWVIPYIGDLVGSDLLHEINQGVGGRAFVAHTIAYRRRKGTLLNLEQVAADVSGMPAMGVEFFRRLITNQSMRHLRLQNLATPDLRRGGRLEKLDSAFDPVNRTVTVRRIAPRFRPATHPDPMPLDITLHGGGKFNLPNLGIYLWRWEKNLSVTNSPAFAVGPRGWLFSPLGQDLPLFNAVPAHGSFTSLTTRMDVPQPIRRREFYAHLDAFYGLTASFSLVAGGLPVPASQICCRDLSTDSGGTWGCVPAGKIGIDPELGRIKYASDLPVPKQLLVNYTYGAGANIGGGAYLRSYLPPAQPTFRATVGSGGFASLEAAVAAWNNQPAGSAGLILLPGFASHQVDLTGAMAIQLPAGSQLWILAAQIHADGTPSFDQSCASLWGNLEIQGGPVPANAHPAPPPGSLFLGGLWIAGSLTVNGSAAALNLMDCTLVPGISLAVDGQPIAPGEPSLVVASLGSTVSLVRCISGPLSLAAGGGARLCSCIIDAGCPCHVAFAGPGLAAEGPDLHVENSTLIGKVWTRSLPLASNTIFLARRPQADPWLAAVWCARRQIGCIRFCFVPADSITPKRFECLPDVAANEAEFLPRFITLSFGRPSYGMLSGDTPLAVWTGADDGGSMGAFHFRQETPAVRNVQLSAPEYLPFGLEAGIFLVPSQAIPVHRPGSGYGYGYHPRPASCAESDFGEMGFSGIGAHLI